MDWPALARRIDSRARVVACRALTGGVSATVTELHLDVAGTARRVVVRQLGPAGVETARMEFALLGALWHAGVRVPEPVHLAADQGCVVIGFVEGTTEVAAVDVAGALEQMAAFLAHLHGLDPAPVSTVAGLMPREDPIRALVPLLPPHLAHLAPRLSLRSGNAPAVLHGDFWPGNVLWRHGRIAAVVDWEDAAVGDPVSDLAGSRLEVLWRYGPEAMASYTDAYLQRRRLDLADLPLWELKVALAASAAMEHWGLEPQAEARMRRLAEAHGERAAARLVDVTRGDLP